MVGLEWKIHLSMDDDRGYSYFRKPSHMFEWCSKFWKDDASSLGGAVDCVDLSQPLSFSCETVTFTVIFWGHTWKTAVKILHVLDWRQCESQYQEVSEIWHHNHAAQCYGAGNGLGGAHPPVALVAETYADGWLVKGFSRSMLGGYHAKGLVIGKCALSTTQLKVKIYGWSRRKSM